MVDETQDVWVCATCGVEYPPGPEPERCPICEDERQYVPAGGQRWTTLAQLARDGASVEIAEVEPDLMILPLACFDARGHRIGYGGGNFDATLAAVRTRRRIVAIGLAYADQEVDMIPHEAHDQRLDFVITEQRLFECGASG